MKIIDKDIYAFLPFPVYYCSERFIVFKSCIVDFMLGRERFESFDACFVIEL